MIFGAWRSDVSDGDYPWHGATSSKGALKPSASIVGHLTSAVMRPYRSFSRKDRDQMTDPVQIHEIYGQTLSGFAELPKQMTTLRQISMTQLSSTVPTSSPVSTGSAVLPGD